MDGRELIEQLRGQPPHLFAVHSVRVHTYRESARLFAQVGQLGAECFHFTAQFRVATVRVDSAIASWND